MSEQIRESARWWRLYRQERAKVATPRTPLSAAETVAVARRARKRYDEEKP